MLVKSYKYIVTAVNKLTPKVIEVVLESFDKKQLEFVGGQFVSVTFEQAGLPKEFHPFSLVSAPDEAEIKLVIKALGDYTGQLVKELKAGAKAELRGPWGNFTYQLAEYKDQIWVAGGIGVTPFVSMAQELISQEEDYQIDFYYCVRHPREAVYADLLERVEEQAQGRLKMEIIYSAERGRINVDYIEQNSGGLKQKDILICTPPQMIEELSKGLLGKGVSEKNIHWEKF